MSGSTYLTIAIAAIVLIGGAAAVGAASPADQANQTASDAYEEHASGNDLPVENPGIASDERPDRSNNGVATTMNVGPTPDLPEQVPDHVSTIHETIQSFLDGSNDTLGESLSELLGDHGESADDNGDVSGEAAA